MARNQTILIFPYKAKIRSLFDEIEKVKNNQITR